VSGALSVQRIGERIIRRSCRQFPADVADDRCREWAAELSAILDDASIRSRFLRALRALAFCAGIARTTRQLSRPARAAAPRGRPSEMAVRVVIGLGVWVVIVAIFITVSTVLTPGSQPGAWPLLVVVPLGIGFDAFCLTDIVRAADVRYLPKWAWALICLAQMPLGGILYLTIGRIGPAQPAPPST
jgi:Phospholipase_D-nuclease N-terminal